MDNTLTGLASESCQTSPIRITDPESRKLLETLSGWVLLNHAISKDFTFRNFSQVMGFVNSVAWIAQRQNHHPDVTFSYNTVKIRFSTHSSGGLTRNDFICAAKVESLLQI